MCYQDVSWVFISDYMLFIRDISKAQGYEKVESKKAEVEKKRYAKKIPIQTMQLY